MHVGAMQAFDTSSRERGLSITVVNDGLVPLTYWSILPSSLMAFEMGLKLYISGVRGSGFRSKESQARAGGANFPLAQT